jgi:hypothetical protein
MRQMLLELVKKVLKQPFCKLAYFQRVRELDSKRRFPCRNLCTQKNMQGLLACFLLMISIDFKNSTNYKELPHSVTRKFSVSKLYLGGD